MQQQETRTSLHSCIRIRGSSALVFNLVSRPLFHPYTIHAGEARRKYEDAMGEVRQQPKMDVNLPPMVSTREGGLLAVEVRKKNGEARLLKANRAIMILVFIVSLLWLLLLLLLFLLWLCALLFSFVSVECEVLRTPLWFLLASQSLNADCCAQRVLLLSTDVLPAGANCRAHFRTVVDTQLNTDIACAAATFLTPAKFRCETVLPCVPKAPPKRDF